jgi:hypothetical protein
MHMLLDWHLSVVLLLNEYVVVVLWLAECMLAT